MNELCLYVKLSRPKCTQIVHNAGWPELWIVCKFVLTTSTFYLFHLNLNFPWRNHKFWRNMSERKGEITKQFSSACLVSIGIQEIVNCLRAKLYHNISEYHKHWYMYYWVLWFHQALLTDIASIEGQWLHWNGSQTSVGNVLHNLLEFCGWIDCCVGGEVGTKYHLYSAIAVDKKTVAWAFIHYRLFKGRLLVLSVTSSLWQFKIFTC